MGSKRKAPLVAICGRPNVGKSTLFNRIIGKQRAIVHDQEGITRDRFYGEAVHQGRAFRVVDTGGIIENPIDPISRKMQEQVQAALEEAAVVVFVIDGQSEATRVDEHVRDALFKLGKPVVLAVNKLDNPKLEMNRYDFYALGLGEPYPVSSGHNLGMPELLDAIVAHFPEGHEAAEGEREGEEGEDDGEGDKPAETGPVRVAIVGKPNVGKSSFINAILNEARVIVDDTPGTTRDAIDIPFHWKGTDYLLIDTAGLRRKAGIKQFVEHFSVTRSLKAMRRADVCLVMIDGTDGISEQDKRIIGYCIEQGTPMVLVWTKWDLVEDKARRFKNLPEEIDLKFPHLHYVPYVTVSNLTRQRIFTVFEYVDRVAEMGRKRIPTAEFNQFIEEVKLKHQPPSRKGRQGKIRYGTQSGVRPTTFVLFVNNTDLFHFSYMRFIENQLRERYGFDGVPLKLELRQGKPRK